MLTRLTDPSGRQPGVRFVSWSDDLRNALAFAVFAAIYALLAGWILHVRGPSQPLPLLAALGRGYVLAAVVFGGAHAVAWTALSLAGRGRRAALLPLAAPLVSLVGAAVALPRLVHAGSLPILVEVAAFLGAGLAFSTARGFYAGLQQRLVPAQRVRDFLERRPAVGQWLLRSIGSLLKFGRYVPRLLGAGVFFSLPPRVRESAGGYVIVIAAMVHLLNQRLLEELTVWVFLHALRQGDYWRAGRLPIRPARLAAEIAAAPADLEVPFARFMAHGMNGPAGLALTPAALGRLIPVYLATYGLAAERHSTADLLTPNSASAVRPAPEHRPLSLPRRLLEHGIRFQVETEASVALEPLPLPRWSELWRAEARARLAERHPDEPEWRVVARLYDGPVRGLLLPISLLWLPLLGMALALVGPGYWLLPLVGAALSFGLLVWLTMLYGNWIFDESLRRHDFAFLARQLGQGRLPGELEDALGSRDPQVRERAVELLLFDDDIARLGITVPPAGLRKFLKRVG